MTRYFRELSVAAVLVVLVLVLAIAAPAFFDAQPLFSRLARDTSTLVAACGMTLVILCRQIDISIGSQFAVCGVCARMLAAGKAPPFVVCAAPRLIGATLGAFNGAL